jgi:acetyl-CoA acyltransferase 1
MPMGMTSENVAERYGIGREAQDGFALESHRRAEKARESGHFEKEIVEVTIRVKNEETGEVTETVVAKDDGIRSGLTLEKLQSLKPVFKENGGSTAGNS